MGFLKSIGNSIGSVISAPFDAFSGKKQQENANKMAMQAWEMANDYNHPVQQMQRLKDAGLNPLLVYGSGSVTGNTTSQPALVGGGISTTAESAFKGLGNVMSVLQGQANLDNTHAQTKASNAGAALSGAQASNVNAQTAINEKKAKYEEKALIADIDYKDALTRKLYQDARASSANADMLEAENELFGTAGGSKGVNTGLTILQKGGRLVKTFMGK